MLDPAQVAAVPRPRELSAAALRAQRRKRKALRRARKDQETVLNRAFDARRVGDVINFEKDLREVLSRGACLPTPSSTVAAHELALFLCQGGGGGELATRAASGGAEPACSPRTQAEADRLLASLGFGFRLAPQVLNYAEVSPGPAAPPGSSRKRGAAALAPSLPAANGSSSNGGSSGPASIPLGSACGCAAFDDVLAPALLADLRYAFRKESLFWEDHGYPTAAFFSYNYPLPGREGSRRNHEGAPELDSEPPKIARGAFSPSPVKPARHKGEGSSGHEEEEDEEDEEEAERSLRFRLEHSWLGDGTEGGREHCVARLVAALQPLVAAHWPSVAAEATSVEWWAHRRAECADGHQLHYDLDELRLKGTKPEQEGEGGEGEDEGKGGGGSVHCPLLSCVLYLEPGPANPTLVTNHALPGVCRTDAGPARDEEDGEDAAGAAAAASGGAQKKARGRSGAPTPAVPSTAAVDAQGWLCYPAANRLLGFDGALLHGVVPPKPTHGAAPAAALAGPATSATSAATPAATPPPRVTLMLGWWGAGVRQSRAPTGLPSAQQSYYAGPPPFAGGTPVTAMQSLADLILPGEEGGGGDEDGGGAFELSEIIASSDEEMLMQGALAGSSSDEDEVDAEDTDDLDGVFECEFDCGLRGTQAEVEAHEVAATAATCCGKARRDAGDAADDDEGDEGEEGGGDEYEEEENEGEGLVLGPNMPMDRAFRWLDEECFGAHLLHDGGHRHKPGTRPEAAAAAAEPCRAVALEHVPRVWAPVGRGSGPPKGPAAGAAEVAFVGRWFVAHPAEIDRDVLAARAPPPVEAAAGDQAPALPEFMSIADALAAMK